MKIGIVNDLTIAAEALRRAVGLLPEHRVVWTARDGEQAAAMCARDTPDLILMDLLMPKMNGVEATRRIMASTPCAILIVTASVDANATQVFEAMGHGALDAVDIPAMGKDLRASAAVMLAKIGRIGAMLSSKSAVLKTLPNRYEAAAPRPASALAARVACEKKLLAIGASAGGPAALAQMLSALPRDFPAAVVVVQHVSAQFASGMAKWLGDHAKMPVRLAEEGERPMPGIVLMAGTADHLTLKSAERVSYTAEPSDYIYRPSVDVFFHSVCRWWPGKAVGVLLTGMGRDGAAGLKALRDKGHHTIAQDHDTSAVYGMPKAAALLNAAVDILPLKDIAPRLNDIFR